MNFPPAPTQSAIHTALRSFLLNFLPDGVEVIQGQQNRVSEPKGVDFVVFTPILRQRLGTNYDIYADCLFQGSVSGTTLTVSSINFGLIPLGELLFGPTVLANTVILSQLTGTAGGTGTYQISATQTINAGALAAGVKNATQPTSLTFQLDFHSANVTDASDMAQTVATITRDLAATDYFAANTTYPITPLYAEDPRQVPFMNAQQQWETRWIVDVVLQADQEISIPQQFAGQVGVTIHPTGT